jgi:hypothetical protein
VDSSGYDSRVRDSNEPWAVADSLGIVRVAL